MDNDSDAPLPDLYGYLDYRRYLSDWLAAKKASNPRYSYRMFARQAGQKSPSLLHHVIRGDRNLTAATTEAFATALRLTAAETAFFQQLVKLNQASSDAERNEAWSRIAATRRFRDARQVEGASFEYLSHWYYPAIRELSHRSDFNADPEWVASTLTPPITRARAERALETLYALQMLVRDAHGTVRPAEASVVTPHEVAGLAVHNYHHGMLERATEAIDLFDPEERQLGGLTVAVPASLIPALKDALVAFQERFLDLCDAAPDAPDRVYQLNLQFFPLSEARTHDE